MYTILYHIVFAFEKIVVTKIDKYSQPAAVQVVSTFLCCLSNSPDVKDTLK